MITVSILWVAFVLSQSSPVPEKRALSVIGTCILLAVAWFVGAP